jgi:hypothetical protein
VAGHGLDNWQVEAEVLVGSRIFSSPRHPDQFRGPPSLLSNGYSGSFPREKWLGCEADHSFPTSTKAKKTWMYTSTPQYVAMRLVLN